MKDCPSLATVVLALSQISSTGALPISRHDDSIASSQSSQQQMNGTIFTAPNITGTVNTRGTGTYSDLTMEPSLESNEAPDVPADETKEHQCPTDWAKLVELANRPGSAVVDIKSGNDTIASFLFDEGEIPGLLQALCAREEGTLLATRDEPTPIEIMLNHALKELDTILDNQKEQAHISDHNNQIVQEGLAAIAGIGGIALIILFHQCYGEAMAKAFSTIKHYVVDSSSCLRRRREDSRTSRSRGVELRDFDPRTV
jgi:hypothetical protein